MKNVLKSKISIFLIFLLILMSYTSSVLAQDGTPSPEEVFKDEDDVGHAFTENYFDINVVNNSIWEVDNPEMDIDNQTTWLNNTWNVKWMKEGNFEMMMLAFMNKSGSSNSATDKFVTPAQFWAQHFSINGHEILIANMLTAWFGFTDENDNDAYDDGEKVNPFMMFSSYDDYTRNEIGIDRYPDVIQGELEKTESNGNITYSWWYNYTNQMFYLPRVNQTLGNHSFEWGFDYDDVGSYTTGSFGVGVFDYVYYEYRLEIDPSNGRATLSNDYIQGDLSLKTRDNPSAPWSDFMTPESDGYMPTQWSYCIGNWAMIMTGTDEDYELLDTDGSEINASTAVNGLTTVKTKVQNTHAFDFAFSQKPQYTLTELGDPTNTSVDDVVYESVDIEGNDGFLELVSGMTSLIGPFAQLMISYLINQTNNFVGGITFEEAWDAFDPSSTAALFISCYPDYGEYKGGVLNHDPTFTAFYTPTPSGGDGGDGGDSLIPGYSNGLILLFSMLGIVIVIKRLKIKNK